MKYGKYETHLFFRNCQGGLMTKIEKITKIEALIAEGTRLQQLPYTTNTIAWQDSCRVCLSKLFPQSGYDVKFCLFFSIKRRLRRDSLSYTETEQRQTNDYRTRIEAAIIFLRSRSKEIQEWDEEDTFNETTPLVQVSRICERFSCTLIPLKSRRQGHAPYIINDEYDMQDIFHAYLSLFFDDIVPEEPMPKVAGSASTIDFFLKDSGIGIELKTTVSGKTKKSLKEDLIQDMTDYRAHPGIKQLVFLIYDPGRIVDHPKLFERELEQSSKISAIVIVRY